MKTITNQESSGNSRRIADKYAFFKIFILVFLFSVLSSCFNFYSQLPPKYVPADNEVNYLTGLATGYLLVNQGWDAAAPEPARIIALSFPDMKETMVRKRNIDDNWVNYISGPDNQGRIAFMEEGKQVHRLKTIYVDGSKEELIFERPGKILWEKSVGKALALSPKEGLVAFTGKGSPNQNPGALLFLCPIQIWDINTKTGYDSGLIAIDHELWWSPDGKELAYIALVDRNKLEKGNSLPGNPYGSQYEREDGRWNKYPAVYIFNLEKKESRLLHAGWHPVFSPDWKTALVTSGDDVLVVDVKTGKSTLFKYPKAIWRMPRILLPDNFAIFIAYPTEGTPPRWLKSGSFSRGSFMDAIKLGEIGTWKFQTIIPYHDFRDPLSFGIVTNPAFLKR